MPPFLRVEVGVPSKSGQQWDPVGEIHPGDPAGTISDNRPGGRDVYLFGVDSDGGYVRKSEGGIDVEQGGTRTVYAAGVLSVATLVPGESHELTVTTPAYKTRTVRFTYIED